MKKKLAALLCAAMLACALPALAWADEADQATADQATAQESAAARSIGPWQESASNEDGSCVLSGETRASSFAVIATSETADDALDGMPSFRVVAENATKKIDFGVALLAGGQYAGCNKLEVHVKPSAGSAGIAKTFEVTRAVDQSSFNFTSEMFNLGDQEGDASYSADFVMTLVPSKADVDEPAADEPAADTPAPTRAQPRPRPAWTPARRRAPPSACWPPPESWPSRCAASSRSNRCSSSGGRAARFARPVVERRPHRRLRDLALYIFSQVSA